MWKALGYAWRVATNIFYALVVWYRLDKIQGRTESIIVPILGLLYTTIRTTTLGQAQVNMAVGTGLSEIVEQIRSLRNPDYEPNHELHDEARKLRERTVVIIWMQSVLLSVVSLLYLWKLFTEL